MQTKLFSYGFQGIILFSGNNKKKMDWLFIFLLDKNDVKDQRPWRMRCKKLDRQSFIEY